MLQRSVRFATSRDRRRFHPYPKNVTDVSVNRSHSCTNQHRSLAFSLFSCQSIGQGYKEYITCVIDYCVAILLQDLAQWLAVGRVTYRRSRYVYRETLYLIGGTLNRKPKTSGSPWTEQAYRTRFKASVTCGVSSGRQWLGVRSCQRGSTTARAQELGQGKCFPDKLQIALGCVCRRSWTRGLVGLLLDLLGVKYSKILVMVYSFTSLLKLVILTSLFNYSLQCGGVSCACTKDKTCDSNCCILYFPVYPGFCRPSSECNSKFNLNQEITLN